LNNKIIEYNKAIEFISSIVKYSKTRVQQASWNSKELKDDLSQNVMDFCPTKEIKEWLEHVEDEISPFLRNDILLLQAKTFPLLDDCYKLIIDNDLQDYHELMDTLRAIDSTKLIEMMYNDFEMDLPFTSDDKILKSGITELYDVETASYFVQAKKHPDEFKKHVIDVFEEFYNLYYEPYEDTVYAFMKEKTKELNELYKNNFVEFINTVGVGDYSEFIVKDKKFRTFVSYYIDFGMFNFYNNDTFVMFCGYSTERLYSNKTIQTIVIELFKALSDERRIEIIKTANKRSLYNKELSDYFNLTPATLSYHINLLLDLEILNFEPSINNRYYYRTNPDNLKKLFGLALGYLLE
jgi:DNA-binding transcriptional ArsR family regulator